MHGLVQGVARFGPQRVFSARGGVQLVGMDGVQAVNFTLANALPVSPSDHVGRAVGGQTQERDACMGGLGQRRAVVQAAVPDVHTAGTGVNVAKAKPKA